MEIEITQTKIREALKYFSDIVSKIIDDNSEIETIVTNGKMACSLQDSELYKIYDNDSYDKNGNYNIGSFYNKNVFVDPNIAWSNMIFFKKDNINIIELTIIDKNNMLI